ncbi:MAG TPA: tol-pal system protein YbgF [Nitrospiria bacterium]
MKGQVRKLKGHSAGAHEGAPRHISVWRSTGAVVGVILILSGCATQADVMDMETRLDKKETQQSDVLSRLQVIENYFKERSTTVQRGQADIVIKLDQVAADLQAMQGKLEETIHRVGEMAQRTDDQVFRSKDLTGRLDSLDVQLASMEKTVEKLTRAVTSMDKSGGFSSDLRGGEGSDGPPGAGSGKTDSKVLLPGRPTDPDKATGLSPSEAYGLAYNDFLKGNYELALMGFQNFLAQFKSTSLAPNAQYWIGESLYGKKEFSKSIEAFDKVVSDYPRSDKVPAALLKGGYAFIELGDKSMARGYLKKVLEGYPLTTEAKLAKNKLAELK